MEPTLDGAQQPTAEQTKGLMSVFKNVVTGYVKTNEDNGVLKFLKTTVNVLEGVVKRLDKYLKSKNIDVREKLKDISVRGNDTLGKAKSVLRSAKDSVADKGFFGAIKGGLLDAKTRLKNAYDGEMQTSGAPPPTEPELTGPAPEIVGPPKPEMVEGAPVPKKSWIGGVRDKATNLKDKAFSTATALYNNARSNQPNILQTVQNTASDLTQKASEAANTGLTRLKAMVAPQEPATVEERVEQTIESVEKKPAEESSFLQGLKDAVADFTSAVQQFSSTALSKPEENKSGGSEYEQAKNDTPEVTSSKSKSSDDYKDALKKADERADKRKAEVEAEKKAVKDKHDGKNKDKKGGWLGQILGAIGTLGGFVVSKLGTILKWTTLGLGKLVAKGAWWALSKIVPGLTTSIARATQTAMGNLLKGTARGAWGLAKTAVTRGVPALWTGAKVAGAALAGAIGTTGMVAIGGVLAAGALIYGGYKLYKYLNRNNIDKDIFGQLTRFRLLMYGFNDAKKESYYKLVELEMMMKDYIHVKDNKVHLARMDNSVKEKIRELFGVKLDEKEKLAILNTWYVKRFMPAFKMFADALMPMAPNIYLDTIDKLNKDQVFHLAAKLIVPTQIYDVTQVPTFEDPTTTVSKQEVDNMLASIIAKAKQDSKALSSDSPDKTKQDTDKKNDQTSAQAAAKAKETTKAGIPPVVPPKSTLSDKAQEASQQGPASQQAQRDSMNRLGGINLYGQTKKPELPGQEGEAPPGNPTPQPTPGQPQETTPSSASNVPVATGELKPADPNLQGVAFTEKDGRQDITQVHPKVFSLFTGMAKEYNEKTGKKLLVTESFRTYEDQMALKRKYGPRAAAPGSSVHEYGIGLDVNTPDANLLDELGLMRKYGFTRPVGGETWHLEPAGVALDPQRAKADPQAREQAIDTSPGRGGGGYGTVPGSRKYGRNTKLQEQIYKKAAETPVDTTEVVAKLKDVPAYEPPKDPPPTPTETTTQTAHQSATPAPKEPTPPPADKTPSYRPSLQGGYAGSVAKTQTDQSLRKSGVDTTPATTLAPTPPVGNANLDMGQVTDGNLNPVQAIKKAANVVGMNPDTMVTFAKLESSLDPNAGAKTSSAKGLFQIVGETWRKELLPKYGPKYNVPPDADIFDPYYNSLMGISYAKQNSASVVPAGQKAGLRDETSLYLAHHFGPSGSKKIIDAYSQAPNEPIRTVVSASTYNSNLSALQGKTVGSYIQSLEGKMQTASSTPAQAYKGFKNATGTNPSTTASKADTDGFNASQSKATTPVSPPPQYAFGDQVFNDDSDGVSDEAPKSAPSASVQERRDFQNTSGLYKQSPSTPQAKMERTEVAAAAPVQTTPVPQPRAVPTELPPQPSLTQNLNPSNEILTNQLNVLVDIKKILEGMSQQARQPYPAAPQEAPLKKLTSDTTQQTPTQQNTPYSRPNPTTMPTTSANAISLSRRVLT